MSECEITIIQFILGDVRTERKLQAYLWCVGGRHDDHAAPFALEHVHLEQQLRHHLDEDDGDDEEEANG
jgi:hypothetical protein